MDNETRATDPDTTPRRLTWLELARLIASMTPEQKRRPVLICGDSGHIVTPGLVIGEGNLPDESDPSSGTHYLVRDMTPPEVSDHPADRLVLVAMDLDDGEEPPADFETVTGIYYRLSEVEEQGDGRRIAWYFQQEPSRSGGE